MTIDKCRSRERETIAIPVSTTKLYLILPLNHFPFFPLYQLRKLKTHLTFATYSATNQLNHVSLPQYTGNNICDDLCQSSTPSNSIISSNNPPRSYSKNPTVHHYPEIL